MTPAPTPDLSSRLAAVAGSPPQGTQGTNDLASRLARVAQGKVGQLTADDEQTDPTKTPSAIAGNPYAHITGADQPMSQNELALAGLTSQTGGTQDNPYWQKMTPREKEIYSRAHQDGYISAVGTAGSLLGVHAAVGAGIKALVPALTNGTLAVGTWASEHPIAAKAIYETLKTAIQGTAIGVGSKIAGKVIDSAPSR